MTAATKKKMISPIVWGAAGACLWLAHAAFGLTTTSVAPTQPGQINFDKAMLVVTQDATERQDQIVDPIQVSLDTAGLDTWQSLAQTDLTPSLESGQGIADSEFAPIESPRLLHDEELQITDTSVEYQFLGINLKGAPGKLQFYDGNSGRVIPLPASIALVGLGVAGLLGLYKSRSVATPDPATAYRRHRIKWGVITTVGLMLMALTWFGVVTLQPVQAQQNEPEFLAVDDVQPQNVPEPGTGAMLILGGAMLLRRVRRRRGNDTTQTVN